jgi:TRAP-type uncharacterized transport system substrate-binding protein
LATTSSKLSPAYLLQIVLPVLLVAAFLVWGVLPFVRSAPPRTLTISAGPKGSSFALIAQRYQKVLARNGIQLIVRDSEGSLDNLARMLDPKSRVNVALVQSGITNDTDAGDLISLGSMFYEPITVFYRSAQPLTRLSELQGQRIAIGKEGSGARSLALALLKANEIEPGGPTQLLPLEGDAARNALLAHQADAIILTGDSASVVTIRAMLHTEGVRLFDFAQADGYVRRFPYLNKLAIPAGAFDLGENLPPHEISLLAPTVELVAHSNLHPALIDLLIQSAIEVHGRASVLQAANQFPNPVIHSWPLSEEASRYYKSGEQSFLYRYLPFWMASVLSRALVVLLPVVVVVVPGLKYLPQVVGWRINRRLHRRYGELMSLERESLGELSQERRAQLIERLKQIERKVITRRIPGSHAEQAYLLRQHISFVRENLEVPEGERRPAATFRF